MHPEPGTRNKLAVWARKIGYEVESASDGALAAERINRGQIALVLYAMDTGKVQDLMAFARVRELPGGKELPILALVDAGAETTARQFGSALGITHYVTSPIDPQALGALIALQVLREVPKPKDEAKAPSPGGQLTIEELRGVHSRLAKQNHFQRLGLTVDDGPLAARKAFKDMTTRYAPGSIAGQEAKRLLRDIYDALGEAYKVLRDPGRREEYVYGLARQQRAEKRESQIGQDPVPPREAPVAEPPTLTPEDLFGDDTSNTDFLNVDTFDDSSAPEFTPPPMFGSPDQSAPLEANAEVPSFEEDLDVFEAPAALFAATPPPLEFSSEDVEPEEPGDDVWGRGSAIKETHEELAAAAHLQAVMGDYEGAVELLEQCLRLKEGDKEYQYMLDLNQGRRFAKVGNKGRARSHFEAAANNARPGSTAAQDELDALLGSDKKSKGSALSRLFGRKKK